MVLRPSFHVIIIIICSDYEVFAITVEPGLFTIVCIDILLFIFAGFHLDNIPFLSPI